MTPKGSSGRDETMILRALLTTASLIVVFLTACDVPRPAGWMTGVWSGGTGPEPRCSECPIVFGFDLVEAADGSLSGALAAFRDEQVSALSGAVHVTGHRERDSVVLSFQLLCPDIGVEGYEGGFRGRLVGNRLYGTVWQVTSARGRREQVLIARRDSADPRVSGELAVARSSRCDSL